jgi:predicted secreted protein
MAVFMQNNAGFQIQVSAAYVDLTNHVQSITINRNFDELEVTAMGATGRQYVAGLETSTIAVDFLNDDAASSVMQTLNTLVGTTAAFKICQTTVAGSPSTATISATNPLYTGLVLVNKLTPVAGKVGDISMQSLTFTVSGAITVASTGTW